MGDNQNHQFSHLYYKSNVFLKNNDYKLNKKIHFYHTFKYILYIIKT